MERALERALWRGPWREPCGEGHGEGGVQFPIPKGDNVTLSVWCFAGLCWGFQRDVDVCGCILSMLNACNNNDNCYRFASPAEADLETRR